MIVMSQAPDLLSSEKVSRLKRHVMSNVISHQSSLLLLYTLAALLLTSAFQKVSKSNLEMPI